MAQGASLKRPRPVVLCPWPAPRRARRVWQLKCLAAHATANEPVFDEDEMDVHLNPKPGRDWMLPGHRRLLVTPGNNRKGYIAGALDARTRHLTWVTSASKTSELFIELLRTLSQAHPRAARLHVILDNASMHSSQKTRRALEEWGGRVVLHFLPPYCPSANKIERVWWDVHAHVTRNHRRADLESLLGDVDTYLEGRNVHATAHSILRSGSAPLAA